MHRCLYMLLHLHVYMYQLIGQIKYGLFTGSQWTTVNVDQAGTNDRRRQLGFVMQIEPQRFMPDWEP